MSGSVVNDYQLAPAKNAASQAMAEDAAGNLFIAGGAIDASGGHHALVRQGVRQADGGVAWARRPSSTTPSRGKRLAAPSRRSRTSNRPRQRRPLRRGQALSRRHWVVVKRSAARRVSVVDSTPLRGRQQRLCRQHGRGRFRQPVRRRGRQRALGRARAEDRPRRSDVQASFTPERAPTWRRSSRRRSGVYATGFGSGHWLTQRGVDDGRATSWSTVDDFKADAAFNSGRLAAAWTRRATSTPSVRP